MRRGFGMRGVLGVGRVLRLETLMIMKMKRIIFVGASDSFNLVFRDKRHRKRRGLLGLSSIGFREGRLRLRTCI